MWRSRRWVGRAVGTAVLAMVSAESNAQKGRPMKTLIAMVLVLCTLGVLSGCHSGIMRGAGADVGRLGDSMQR